MQIYPTEQKKERESIASNNGDTLTVHIRLTKKCNADCSYCSSFERAATPLMSEAQVERSIIFIKNLILERMLGGRRKQLTVQYVGGEVLTVPIDYLKNYYAKIEQHLSPLFQETVQGAQSNLIGSRHKITSLIELFGNRIGTSFDSSTGQRTVKGKSEVYQKIFFQNLSHVKRTTGLLPAGIVVIDKKMLPHIHAEIDQAHAQKRHITLRPVFQGGSNIEGLTAQEIQLLYEKLFAAWFMKQTMIVEPFFSFVSKRLNTYKNKKANLSSISGCPFQHSCAQSSINLEPDGSLYTCLDMADSKHYKLGNTLLGEINEEHFQAVAARTQHLSQQCISCDYFQECQGGCMNEAIEHTGDLYGTTHYCSTWKSLFATIDKCFSTYEINSIEQWLKKISSYG